MDKLDHQRKVPVGATWEAIGEHQKATIWLASRKRVAGKWWEVWKYSWSYIDNSGWESNWFGSYRNTQNWCPPVYKKGFKGKPVRFKRVTIAAEVDGKGAE